MSKMKTLESLLPLSVKGGPYDLSGPEGNAFAIMGTTTKMLKEAARFVEIDQKEIKQLVDEYTNKAMSGDYKNLLAVTKEYVDFDFVGENV